jgi:hypothetical protein
MNRNVKGLLFALLFLASAEFVAQEPKHFMVKNPNAIHFELVLTARGMDLREDNIKPYEVGTRIVVGMDAVNTSQSRIRIPVIDQWIQDRPVLLRSGDKVPYRKQISENLESMDTASPQSPMQGVNLEPGERRRIAYIDFWNWYDALEPGHYQLTVKHRFQQGQEWIESAPIIFDVVPKKRDTRQ